MLAPFRGDQVVVHSPLTRVVDEIVDDLAVHATLEEGAALGIVRVQVPNDENIGDVVVNQASLRMLTLGVRGIRESLGQDVVAERDGVGSMLTPLVRVC